jgi:hypothetical protein
VRRVAEGNYLGCEFTDFGHVDRDTGFYVTFIPEMNISPTSLGRPHFHPHFHSNGPTIGVWAAPYLHKPLTHLML